MLEILETIWGVLTYDPSPVQSSYAIIGTLLGAAGKGLMSLLSGGAEKKRRATQMRWSPWTGVSPDEKQRVDPVTGALQGAGMGAKLEAGLAKTDALKRIAKGGSPYSQMLGGGGGKSAFPDIDPTKGLGSKMGNIASMIGL